MIFFDALEIFSPMIGVFGCIYSIKFNRLNRVSFLVLMLLIATTLLNGYAVYLFGLRKNNILIYTASHALTLSVISYITYYLIKKKFLWLFMAPIVAFAIVFIFQFKNFDAFHSINGVLSAIYAYSLIVYSLIILTLVTRNTTLINHSFFTFSIFFSIGLFVYGVSIFLFFLAMDYVQYLSEAIAENFWYVTLFGVLFFHVLLMIGFFKNARVISAGV